MERSIFQSCRSPRFPPPGKAARPPRKRELRGLSSLILKERQIKPSSFYIVYLSTMAARVRFIRPVNR